MTEEEIPPEDIMLVMAYTDDYSIGRICEEVNRQYASRHRYAFTSSVLSCEDMAQQILPKLHFTWYKILLLKKIMSEILSSARDTVSSPNEATTSASIGEVSSAAHDRCAHNDTANTEQDSTTDKYLCWIDGDAMVIRHHVTIPQLISTAKHKELIIAEDMHPGNPINAGVFFLKVCSWSLELLEEMWQSTKYDHTYFYEQSALIKILRVRKERLDRVRHLHNYLPGGPLGITFFPHVAVIPHLEFSSNQGISDVELPLLLRMLTARQQLGRPVVSKVELLQAVATEDDDEGLCSLILADEVPDMFIYHVAGLRGKLDFLRAAIVKFQLDCTFEEDLDHMDFRLTRGKMGMYLPERLQDIADQQQQSKKDSPH